MELGAARDFITGVGDDVFRLGRSVGRDRGHIEGCDAQYQDMEGDLAGGTRTAVGKARGQVARSLGR